MDTIPKGHRGVLAEMLREYQPSAQPQYDDAPLCATCNDLGWVMPNIEPGRPGHGKPVPCPDCEEGAKLKALRLRAAHARAGAPAHYAELTFKTFNALSFRQRDGKMLAAACAYMWSSDPDYMISPRAAAESAGFDANRVSTLTDRLDTWVVLSGDFGTGKTGLAAAAANEMIRRNRPALFYRVAELLTAIQEEYRREVAGESLLQRVQRADCLILDELTWHAGQPSDDKRRIIEEIVRYRRPQRLPTLITTNADMRGLEDQWGTATVSMIAEGHWIVLRGQQLRIKSPEIVSF